MRVEAAQRRVIILFEHGAALLAADFWDSSILASAAY
jgi:hypothetical protein